MEFLISVILEYYFTRLVKISKVYSIYILYYTCVYFVRDCHMHCFYLCIKNLIVLFWNNNFKRNILIELKTFWVLKMLSKI